MNEIVEGNGTIEVKLNSGRAEDGTLRLVAQMGRIDAVDWSARRFGRDRWENRCATRLQSRFCFILRQGGDFKPARAFGAAGGAMQLEAGAVSGNGLGQVDRSA